MVMGNSSPRLRSIDVLRGKAIFILITLDDRFDLAAGRPAVLVFGVHPAVGAELPGLRIVAAMADGGIIILQRGL